MGNIVCPECEKDDQIQKVTSIVTNGVSTTNYRVENAYGSGSGTAVSQTHLSNRLSPPAKPKLGVVFIVSVSLALPGLLQVLCLLAALLGGSNVTVTNNNDSLSTILGIVGFAVEVFLIYLAINEYQKFKRATQVWENQIATNWSRLYYCYRDDCVFDPRTNKHTTPEGISRLLS